jgi:hypothetical protein
VSDASHHSIDLEHPPPQHSGDVSQSGSDQQSPGSSSADWEDRNHRISFKLFDRHPAEFPEGLRAQVRLCGAQASVPIYSRQHQTDKTSG